jgi:hypothetical protein
MTNEDMEFFDEDDTYLEAAETAHFADAVLHSTDWTVETIVSQLARGNIELNPRFQRRDAWNVRQKSGFIESLVLGLPVPQIVLAEKKGQRGKYIVLDGKQRLLALLQFTGNAEGQNNGFRLTGLEARVDLARKTYEQLNTPLFEGDLNAFLNYTVRTVVIRNWPSHDFLHLVFLRLNTGSVKLSPQELRQAMFPGEFSNAVDDSSAASLPLRTLLGITGPDARMRDVELLVRFLAFHFFLPSYPGRMKDFLDQTCEQLNNGWAQQQQTVATAIDKFNAGVTLLVGLLGLEVVARKQNSKSFNRAIFDALIFYAADDTIRDGMERNGPAVRMAYASISADPTFLLASESDTAGVPNTLTRLSLWGTCLRGALGMQFNVPVLRPGHPGQPGRVAIDFDGFWA